jgi:hypothetical protein
MEVMRGFRGGFTPVAPISQAAFDTYGNLVPPGVAEAWHNHGTGFLGDGYFRLVDPVRARQMLVKGSLPSEAVVLFVSAMADVIARYKKMFLVAKFRLGEIHATSVEFERLVQLMTDKKHRDEIWNWQPYPQTQARLGTPEFEECFMHVPLLGLGGRGESARMKAGSVWIHIELMVKMTGRPRVTHMLPLPTEY